MKPKSFFINALVSVLGAGILASTNLLNGIILSRCLGPSGVGQYQLIISFGIILSVIGSLGINGAVVYFIRSKKDLMNKVATHAFKLSILLSFLLFFILLICYQYSNYFGELNTFIICAAAANGAALLFLNANSQTVLAEQRAAAYQIVQATPRLFLLLFLSFSWVFFDSNLNITITITAIAQVLGNIGLVIIISKYISLKIKLDSKLIKEMIKFGSTMTLAYVVILLNNEAMNIILGFFSEQNFTEIGYFSRAFKTGVGD